MEKHKDVFEANPGCDHIYVTTDGVPFLDSHRARVHQKAINPDAKVEVVTRFAAPMEVEEIEVIKLTAEQRIEAINACQTIEEVEALLVGESAKTVKAAGQIKIEQLNKEGGNNE